MIGAGVNGRAAARTFLARGRDVSLWDVDAERARSAADELGASVAGSLEEALGADLLVTVTPGHEVLLDDGSLEPGQHVSLMGADGPGQGRDLAAASSPARGCSATTGSRRATAASSRMRSRPGSSRSRTSAGSAACSPGDEPGRESPAEITTFDSTGLAIQDLAIALAALERAGELDLRTLAL